jgi:hypothetical protein
MEFRIYKFINESLISSYRGYLAKKAQTVFKNKTVTTMTTADPATSLHGGESN